jgi:hypothetical protein
LDGRKDAIEQISADRNFSKLEGDGSGVTDDTCANLYQPGL